MRTTTFHCDVLDCPLFDDEGAVGWLVVKLTINGEGAGAEHACCSEHAGRLVTSAYGLVDENPNWHVQVSVDNRWWR